MKFLSKLLKGRILPTHYVRLSFKFFVVSLWLTVCAIAGIYLSLQHDLVFSNSAGKLKVDQLFENSSANLSQWRVDHFLAGDCGCSKIVFQSLLNRGAQQEETTERVVIIHPQKDWESQLKSKGFQVASLSSESDVLKEIGLEDHGVPFFSIYSPKKEEVYVGGYSERTVQEDSRIRDVEVLAHFQKGESIANFPIFGCAVSAKYRKLLDPLGIKYAEERN